MLVMDSHKLNTAYSYLLPQGFGYIISFHEAVIVLIMLSSYSGCSAVFWAAFIYSVIAGLCVLSKQTNPSADFWQQSEMNDLFPETGNHIVQFDRLSFFLSM